MDTWEKEAKTITRSYTNSEKKWDINGWFIEMERNMRHHFANKAIENGSSYHMKLESGVVLEIIFHKNYTLLNEIDKNMKLTPLITKEQSYKKELETLQGYGQSLKSNGGGFGYPMPERLTSLMKQLRPGEQITFENGLSFVCMDKNDSVLSLKQVCGSILHESFSELNNLSKKYPVYTIDYLQKDKLQNFYNRVRNKTTDSVVGRKININTTAQEQMNRIIGSLSRSEAKKVSFGPVELHVKKSIFSNAVKWYDETGKQVPEDSVRLLIGWLNTSPVITEFKREHPTNITRHDDAALQERLEKLYHDGYFLDAYDAAITYCEQNEFPVQITTKTYLPNEDSYKATSFVFSCVDGHGVLYQAEYEDNDINKDISSLKQVSPADFVAFCEQKYSAEYFLIQNEQKEQLKQRYPNIKQEMLEKMSASLAEKKMKEKERLKFVDGQIVSPADDLQAFLQSYKDRAKDMAKDKPAVPKKPVQEMDLR